MDRETVLHWFEDHPDAARGEPEEILARCERAVRRHSREDAWLAARSYVARRRHVWERGRGAHASEVYVAREVCHKLADEMRHQEPGVEPGDEEHLAGGPVKDAVSREGWRVLVPWIQDLANEQEHETWSEIVHYTNRLARDLIRRHQLSDDCSFHHSKCYEQVAVRIALLLEQDFGSHAFPH